jgi:FAD/FMN-containing dehydrogenase
VGNKVAYPNSTSYETSAVTYFAQQEGELSPYCYVKPESSGDVSNIVQALALLNIIDVICPFAVRGAGHHTVVGIANIHAGITIDLGNMNQTTVSQDKSTASVGSGARWGSVYSTLVPLGLAVLGGRVADIGVGGFTTGGKDLRTRL